MLRVVGTASIKIWDLDFKNRIAITFEEIHRIYFFSCIFNWQIESMVWISRGWLSLVCNYPTYVASESSWIMWSMTSTRHLIVICWLCGLTKKDKCATQLRHCIMLSFSSLVSKSCFHCFSKTFAFGRFPGEQQKLNWHHISYHSPAQ